MFSLFDLFGNLGGVFEILTIFGSMFVGIFVEIFFNYSIVSSLDHIDLLSYEENKNIAMREKDIDNPDQFLLRDSHQDLDSYELSERQKIFQNKEELDKIAQKASQHSINVSEHQDEANDK